MGVSVNFEGNEGKRPANGDVSTNDQSGTMEDHEEETFATDIEKKDTGS